MLQGNASGCIFMKLSVGVLTPASGHFLLYTVTEPEAQQVPSDLHSRNTSK